jgi:hypothetical protein
MKFSFLMSELERFRSLSPSSDILNTNASSSSSAQPAASRGNIITQFFRNGLSIHRSPRIIPPLSITAPRDRIDISNPSDLTSLSHSLRDHHRFRNPLTDPQSRLSFQAPLSENGDLMGLYYRFFPEHTRFIGSEFRITKRVKNRLEHLSNSIGFSSNIVDFSVSDFFVYTPLGRGLRSLVTDSTVSKKVIEVLTFFNGVYGRLIILVSIGAGCTIWYTFVPGVAEIAPPELYLPRVISYNTFLDVNHQLPPLHKLCFLQTKYITGEVLSALESVYPFTEIPIPNAPDAIPNALDSRIVIGLGIMVAVFLAIGIVPHISTSSLTVQG